MNRLSEAIPDRLSGGRLARPARANEMEAHARVSDGEQQQHTKAVSSSSVRIGRADSSPDRLSAGLSA